MYIVLRVEFRFGLTPESFGLIVQPFRVSFEMSLTSGSLDMHCYLYAYIGMFAVTIDGPSFKERNLMSGLLSFVAGVMFAGAHKLGGGGCKGELRPYVSCTVTSI